LKKEIEDAKSKEKKREREKEKEKRREIYEEHIYTKGRHKIEKIP